MAPFISALLLIFAQEEYDEHRGNGAFSLLFKQLLLVIVLLLAIGLIVYLAYQHYMVSPFYSRPKPSVDYIPTGIIYYEDRTDGLIKEESVENDTNKPYGLIKVQTYQNEDVKYIYHQNY